MDTITKAKWKKLHKDYKSMIDGKPHMLKNVDGATRLVPVKIIEDVSRKFSDIKVEQKINVLLEKNVPNNPKLWSKWIAKAKREFDVYPSAYANAWAAKGYKKDGGTWRKEKKNESIYEDVSYSASRDIGNIRFKVIDKPDSLSYILMPKNSKELDKVDMLKEKYNFTDQDLRTMLASYLSKPNLNLDPDESYRGAGFGLKLVKPKLG